MCYSGSSMRQSTQLLGKGVSNVLRYEKVRFALVGVVNTLVDFALFVTFSLIFGLPATIANIFSTSGALALSYTLNKKAVFGDTDRNNRRQIILFVSITLVGLWIIQGAIIVWLTSFLEIIFPQLSMVIILLGSKIIATGASLTWNYVWYSKVVFKKERK